MPALSKSTLLALFGADLNVPVIDLDYGNNWDAWYTWTQASGRSVVSSTVVNSTTVITFSGGDNTALPVGSFVNFTDDTTKSVYQITVSDPNSNSITIAATLTSAQISAIKGDPINVSIDLTGVTFNWLMQQYTSSGVSSDGKTIDLGTITVAGTPNPANWTTYINLYNAMAGRTKINVPQAALSVTRPVFGDGNPPTPIIYAGAINANFPAGADPIANPIENEVQRIVFLVWSNLSPATAP